MPWSHGSDVQEGEVVRVLPHAPAGNLSRDDLGEEASGDESKEPSKHRKIPTWGEAISVVVDANIEAHAKKPANKPI